MAQVLYGFFAAFEAIIILSAGLGIILSLFSFILHKNFESMVKEFRDWISK